MIRRWFSLTVFVLVASLLPGVAFSQEGSKRALDKPIVVNGDTVEYSMDNKEVSATGNVEVIYKGTKLNCDKLTVNTQTKDSVAEGSVRVEDEKGIVEGTKILYNFNAKNGTIYDAEFRSDPYFGRSNKMDRINETEFIGYDGYATTCSYNRPHYRIKTKKMNFYPQDKIETKKDVLFIGDRPLAYLPFYNHNLKEPIMHVQIIPGKSKEWGAFLLTAWRYELMKGITGRIYYDYRSRLGVAEGFGANFGTENYGKGDFKFYYTQERPSHFNDENQPGEFQRYFARFLHQWAIDEKTDLTTEYFKIVDSKRTLYGGDHNILKDYFKREYEKDSQPLSYILLHRNFSYSSMDVIMQKRVNRWYSQVEKLPEATYSLPNIQIGETPFYFTDSSSFGMYNYKYAVPSNSTDDIFLTRFDTTNKLSLPSRISFINVTPFVGMRNTVFDRDTAGGSMLSSPRNVFITGAEASTKFYRIFNVKSNFLNLDINDLRHIITPTLKYEYNRDPTEPSAKFSESALGLSQALRQNYAELKLSNKLQTKRQGQKVDLADFRVSTYYNFKPEKSNGYGSSFSDFLFETELTPYSWLSIDADATYNHYSDYFSSASLSLGFNFENERSISLGHRYQRKGGRELTFETDWRLNPKWKFRAYERYQFSDTGSYKNGLREQEYSVIRDLHCWSLEIAYNTKKEEGEVIWLIFRLKAFPEIEFNLDQGYHEPKAGSQSG